MFANLDKAFRKIGAQAKVVIAKDGIVNNRWFSQSTPVRLNVITDNGYEQFEIAIRKDILDALELTILEIKPKDEHLLLLARQLDNKGVAVEKHRFLCGRDERHLFVASVAAVSTVAAAKASLKPNLLSEQEIGLNVDKRNRRKTKAFKRQGEWFFVPVEIEVSPLLVSTNEPLRRSNNNKAHVAQFAFRTGGESVMVCNQHPAGLTQVEYEGLIERDTSAKYFHWRQMKRDAMVFAKGKVRHPDHATIFLDGWHRVLMNAEVLTETVAFLD